MATLMTLRRLVRSRIGVPIQDDFFPDAVIDDNINLAIQVVEGEYHWPWSDVLDTVTVTADTPAFPYPANYRATRALMNGANELAPVAPGDFLTYGTATGDPAVYCPMDDVIAVAPAADATLLHYWYRQPAWLREDDDRSVIPEQYSGAVIAKAAELLSSREGAGADVGRHNTEFQSWIARMRRDVRRTTAPTRVRVRPGGWI
jgi:hypothetical protein